jgi:diguanylate cyclase (GGDEF)-like protein
VGTLSRDLALSLGLLYLVLFAISLRVTRRLRRQAIVNAHLAEHDPLTDLPNRARFHREVEDAVRDAERGHFSVVAVLDLDRFKEVNDSLGHINGDALLVALAKRLDRAITAPSTVARIGGDEFGVVIRGCPDPYHFLVALRRVVEEEIEISGLPLSIEASVGFTLLEDEPLTMKEILQRADIAMYSAKEHHTGVSVYEATMARHDAANLGLVAELRRAIDDDQLVLHYQPEATLSDGRVRAIEALVRWRHPTLGLLGPDSFLPLAEQTDIIESLTTWVVRRALADLHRLPAAISVAVNISARTLTRLDFADEVALACADAGIDPRRLIIEVTETALMTDPERAALVLSALAATGIHIALDDFGVGQTSLGYLSLLPVHELKIDRSFVSDMQEDEKHRAIVRSIVELGHNLSLEVIGEGVETASVLDSLERVGCDMVQGYYLARPMEITALVEWLVAAEAPAIGV